MPKRAEKPWTQRNIEFGDVLMGRLTAKQNELGYNNFAEFVRHMSVDYLQRHGDAAPAAPAAPAVAVG